MAVLKKRLKLLKTQFEIYFANQNRLFFAFESTSTFQLTRIAWEIGFPALEETQI